MLSNLGYLRYDLDRQTRKLTYEISDWVVQYRFTGAVMSLETLGQRWGWEKTKVWRFFQKHGDVFALYRLPSSYGCLIFNRQYPMGTAGPVLEEEDIVQLFQRFRAYAAGANCTRSGLNKLIRLYSHAVVAQTGLEGQEEPAKSRVAVFAPIYRACISLCRNCKNCRSYIYDCRGMNYRETGKRGRGRDPDGPVDLNKPWYEMFSFG